ncbi:Atp7b, partial [Symbiodinium pilosum]
PQPKLEESDHTPRMRKWLWELMAWWRYFGEGAPAGVGNLRDQAKRSASRWARARHCLEEGSFTAAEINLLETSGMLDSLEKLERLYQRKRVGTRTWLQKLSAWWRRSAEHAPNQPGTLR